LRGRVRVRVNLSLRKREIERDLRKQGVLIGVQPLLA
jgi:hypothetical protein